MTSGGSRLLDSPRLLAEIVSTISVPSLSNAGRGGEVVSSIAAAALASPRRTPRGAADTSASATTPESNIAFRLSAVGGSTTSASAAALARDVERVRAAQQTTLVTPRQLVAPRDADAGAAALAVESADERLRAQRRVAARVDDGGEMASSLRESAAADVRAAAAAAVEAARVAELEALFAQVPRLRTVDEGQLLPRHVRGIRGGRQVLGLGDAPGVEDDADDAEPLAADESAAAAADPLDAAALVSQTSSGAIAAAAAAVSPLSPTRPGGPRQNQQQPAVARATAAFLSPRRFPSPKPTGVPSVGHYRPKYQLAEPAVVGGYIADPPAAGGGSPLRRSVEKDHVPSPPKQGASPTQQAQAQQQQLPTTAGSNSTVGRARVVMLDQAAVASGRGGGAARDVSVGDFGATADSSPSKARFTPPDAPPGTRGSNASRHSGAAAAAAAAAAVAAHHSPRNTSAFASLTPQQLPPRQSAAPDVWYWPRPEHLRAPFPRAHPGPDLAKCTPRPPISVPADGPDATTYTVTRPFGSDAASRAPDFGRRSARAPLGPPAASHPSDATHDADAALAGVRPQPRTHDFSRDPPRVARAVGDTAISVDEQPAISPRDASPVRTNPPAPVVFARQLPRPAYERRVVDAVYSPSDELTSPRVRAALVRADAPGHLPLHQLTAGAAAAASAAAAGPPAPSLAQVRPSLIRDIDLSRGSPHKVVAAPLLDLSYDASSAASGPRVKGDPMLAHGLSRDRRERALSPPRSGADVVYDAPAAPPPHGTVDFRRQIDRDARNRSAMLQSPRCKQPMIGGGVGAGRAEVAAL